MKLVAKLTLLWLISMGSIAQAQQIQCKPESMSVAEAERISVIAMVQGDSFRREIDALREDGVSMSTDTTLSEILANSEQHLSRAQELYERRFSVDLGIQLRLEGGVALDEALLSAPGFVNSRNTNYFLLVFEKNLQELTMAIGGIPGRISNNSIINENRIVFALGQFIKNAELEYIRGRQYKSGRNKGIQYVLTETESYSRVDRLRRLIFSIERNHETHQISLPAFAVFNRFDFKSNLSISQWAPSQDCLIDFNIEEN